MLDERAENDGDPIPPRNGAATVALTLGLTSFLGGLTAIPGLVFGVIALRRAKQLGGSGRAVTGTVLSVLGLGLGVWLAVWLFNIRSYAERRIAENNLKQIGLALDIYPLATGTYPAPFAHGEFRREPPRVTEAEVGNRLSWRVTILPYLEYGGLHQRMELDESWDSQQNKPYATVVVPQYTDGATRADPDTRYRVFYGPGTAFPLDKLLKAEDVTDGTSNTIFVAESGQKVTWTRFAEMKYDPANPPSPANMGRPNQTTFQVVQGDASVRSIRKTMDPQVFKALITAHAGDKIPPE